MPSGLGDEVRGGAHWCSFRDKSKLFLSRGVEVSYDDVPHVTLQSSWRKHREEVLSLARCIYS